MGILPPKWIWGEFMRARRAGERAGWWARRVKKTTIGKSCRCLMGEKYGDRAADSRRVAFRASVTGPRIRRS